MGIACRTGRDEVAGCFQVGDCGRIEIGHSDQETTMQESEPQVTQRDIARKLGVSNATVSLALRDSSEVGLERRLEIQALAEKMGYRPNPVAAALFHQKRNLNYSEINASIAWLNRGHSAGGRDFRLTRISCYTSWGDYFLMEARARENGATVNWW